MYICVYINIDIWLRKRALRSLKHTVSSPLGPEASHAKAKLAKESLSPASEDLLSLENMLEHSAMFEFDWHFFSKSTLSQLEGPGW